MTTQWNTVLHLLKNSAEKQNPRSLTEKTSVHRRCMIYVIWYIAYISLLPGKWGQTLQLSLGNGLNVSTRECLKTSHYMLYTEQNEHNKAAMPYLTFYPPNVLWKTYISSDRTAWPWPREIRDIRLAKHMSTDFLVSLRAYKWLKERISSFLK